MATKSNARTGGQILVDALKVHGVEIAFGVPGESYLAVLDALHDAKSIRYVICRQESGAANMAEAYGKLTGQPGICFVTRGPGATNASIGVHTAHQDSTPMILFVGQCGRDMMERESFQEIDYRRMFGPMTKWVAQIDDAKRIPELVSHAFHTALAGRPGPVVLALPEDMLTELADVADAEPHKAVQAHPGEDDMRRLRDMLQAAKRPFVIVGGAGWDARAKADMESFAEANELPVGTAWRRQDSFDNRHRCYAGDVGIGINPLLGKRIKEADLLLIVGPRMGEMTTGGYELLDIPRPRQKIVHVHAGAEELGRVYQVDLPIVSGMANMASALRRMKTVDSSAWRERATRANEEYKINLKHQPMPGPIDLGEILAHLRKTLPAEAIITNGAGNYSIWAHRFYQFRKYGTQLAPTSGAMGYGLPAAIAAKLKHPDVPVVCFAGDGCFLMTGQEMATAVAAGANIVVIVVNNGMYGTIRMHQEREYPGRIYGTALGNPDFAAYAKAFGAHGEAVERTADFPAAFARALEAGRPALIELRIDPDAITPRTTLGAIRKAALEKSKS
jgi:acetolactate synthase-1/2/3 large subunit